MNAYQRYISGRIEDETQISVGEVHGIFAKCFTPRNTGMSGILLQKLKVFQKHLMVFYNGTDVLECVLSKRDICSHIVAVAWAVGSFPRSQIENERIFSIADISSKHRRSKMKTERTNEIINVFKNLPDDPLNELGREKRLYDVVHPVVAQDRKRSELDIEISLSEDLEYEH